MATTRRRTASFAETERPEFDVFHPNASACRNACEAAEKGNWRDALDWLSEATTALEFSENVDDNARATTYVEGLAELAGVNLKKVPPKKQPKFEEQTLQVTGLTVGEALRVLAWGLPTYPWVKKYATPSHKFTKYAENGDYRVRVRRASWPEGETLRDDPVGGGCVETTRCFVRLHQSPSTHYPFRAELWVPTRDDLVSTDWQVTVSWTWWPS